MAKGREKQVGIRLFIFFFVVCVINVIVLCSCDNKILFELSQSNFDELKSERERYILINTLAGYRAFFINSMRYMIDPVQTKKMERKIQQTEKAIDKIRALPIQQI